MLSQRQNGYIIDEDQRCISVPGPLHLEEVRFTIRHVELLETEPTPERISPIRIVHQPPAPEDCSSPRLPRGRFDAGDHPSLVMPLDGGMIQCQRRQRLEDACTVFQAALDLCNSVSEAQSPVARHRLLFVGIFDF